MNNCFVLFSITLPIVLLNKVMGAQYTKEQFVNSAKAVHGNKYNYDKVVYKNSKIKIEIICPDHGEFRQVPNSHLNGNGCPKCGAQSRREHAKKRRVSAQQFIKAAKTIHGDKYIYDKVVYRATNTKVTIICPDHGEFLQNPYNHKTGEGCPKCAPNRKLNTREFIKKAIAIHGDKYRYDDVEYVRNDKKVIIICPIHGNFEQTPHAHTSKRVAGCPACGGTQKGNTKAFIEAAKKIHGNKYNYDKVEYKSNKKYVIISCPEHGDFRQFPQNHLRQGCSACSGTRKGNTKAFIEAAKKIHGNKYNYDKVEYKNNKTKVIIICKKHGEFKQSPKTHVHMATGCSRCTNKAEGKLADYLNKLFIVHRRFWIERKEYDFFLPDFNLIIERDGEQHYKENNLFSRGDNNYLSKQHENDLFKTRLAKKKGYKIARIPYWLSDKEVKREIDNIISGNPSYPDVPNLNHEISKPKPVN